MSTDDRFFVWLRFSNAAQDQDKDVDVMARAWRESRSCAGPEGRAFSITFDDFHLSTSPSDREGSTNKGYRFAVTMTQLRLIRNVPVDEGRTAADGPFRDLSAREVADWLRAGTCPSERSFDQFLSEEHRLASSQYWTPLVVVLRVAEWLNALPIKTVVDIGSGAGKFCVATALATQCNFIGIEQRVRLVSAARKLAKTFGVDDRTRFIQRTLSQDGLPKADAYYLYNPFAEHLFGPEEHLDEDVEFNGENYAYDVATVEAFLDQAPAGTYIISYNGFGGRVPLTYDEVHVDREMPNVLRMWQKSGRQRFERRPR